MVLPFKISPSILSADFGHLQDEIVRIEKAGADLIHVDVMDGLFVPNITIGPPVIRMLKSKLPLDVHLMIRDPIRYIAEFVKAGAGSITVHFEACKDVGATIDEIRRLGCRAAATVRPKTPIEKLFPYLSKLDMVLVMSVEPGFSGQKFMPEVVPKIEKLRARYSGDIEVDGGITEQNVALVRRAGANVVVAGSYIFSCKNYAEPIRRLREAQ